MQSAPKRLDRVAPETPAVLVDLVERCLEKTPADRPDSADEIVRQLRGLADALTSPGTSVRTAGQVAIGPPLDTRRGRAPPDSRRSQWRCRSHLRGDTTEPTWRHQSLVTTSALESGSRISPDSQWISFISTGRRHVAHHDAAHRRRRIAAADAGAGTAPQSDLVSGWQPDRRSDEGGRRAGDPDLSGVLRRRPGAVPFARRERGSDRAGRSDSLDRTRHLPAW